MSKSSAQAKRQRAKEGLRVYATKTFDAFDVRRPAALMARGNQSRDKLIGCL
jgi:hypothetical protein